MGRYERPERIIDLDTGETARTVTFEGVIAPKKPRSRRRSPEGGPLALFVVLRDGSEWWIPRSQIVREGDVRSEVDLPGDTGRLVVTLWFCQLAENKDLLKNPGAKLLALSTEPVK